MLTAEEIVAKANELGASDIHIVKGLPIRCRVDGTMEDLTDYIMDHDACEIVAKDLVGDDYASMAAIGELDRARTFCGTIRTRLNVFRQQGSASAAIRILNNRIPTLQDLNLPPVIGEFPSYRTGLVLITGETGSGKSTTLAALLDAINHSRSGHIITLEDPIEYIYTPDQCVINQREVGSDTASYASGLRAILREDPDVILIGEMRDLNTIDAALTAAETGHLVFATLHTNSAADTIDRIVNVFPEGQQKQIRMQLSTTLRAVVAQQLIKRRSMKGRVAACEIMIVTPAIRNLIREGKTTQIDSFITLNSQDGSISMDAALQKLVRDGVISQEQGLSYCRDKEHFTRLRK